MHSKFLLNTSEIIIIIKLIMAQTKTLTSNKTKQRTKEINKTITKDRFLSAESIFRQIQTDGTFPLKAA